MRIERLAVYIYFLFIYCKYLQCMTNQSKDCIRADERLSLLFKVNFINEKVILNYKIFGTNYIEAGLYFSNHKK